MFMRDLLAEKARDILRSKGVLCIKVRYAAALRRAISQGCGAVSVMSMLLQGQENTKFVFQGVHETICFGPAAQGWRADETRISQIVFIGRNLQRKVGRITLAAKLFFSCLKE